MLNENDVVRLVFGLKLRSLRQARGLSYQQLSEATGLALSYLHDIENGKKYPKANKILALAKSLGVDYDYLVSLSGGKKLQPVIDLLQSDFVNVIPWQHFGISLSSLLSLFTNTPDKVTAFISTLIKIFRSYEMSRESFYTAALRSYQDLHDNYLDDVELAAGVFLKEQGLEEQQPLDAAMLADILATRYGIRTDRKKMAATAQLSGVRAYYAPAKKTLFLNKLSPAQEAFILARELGFQYLQITERPYETMMRQPASFDTVLNNFRASYFAAAVLIPEDSLAEDLNNIIRKASWNGNLWLETMNRYNATPEMFLQRLTNILPRHFGVDQLFFLRMTSDAATGDYEITKELHLSQLHNPHANSVNEHYCRRWIAAQTMQQVSIQSVAGKFRKPLIDVQISQYWETHNRYLCISIAKPQSRNSADAVSVTIGLALDNHLLQSMPFVHDPTIPVRIVNTACERCSIMDCKERAVAPVVIRQKEQEQITDLLLRKLND